VIGLAAGLLVLAPVLGRGVVLSYDMVFVPDPPLTGAVLGTDGSVPRAVPTELLADLLARVLPVVAVQQGLLLAAFVLAGAGAARLVPGLPGAAAAAVGYAWTPYVAERLLIGHWTFLLGFAVLVNLPWIVPAVARPGGVPADPAGVAAFAARADTPLGLAGSLLTLGGIWNPATVPAGRDSALAAVALVAVLAALALGGREVLATNPGLVVAALAGAALAAAGAVPGLDAVLRAVVVHVPGGGLLRDGQKLLAPAALVVALAAGTAVGRLARTPRTAPWAALLAALPVLALPTLAWGVGGRLAAAHYPADWLALRAAVHGAPPGAVAALPWGTYRRLDWAGDRVVLDPLPRLLDRRTLADDALPLSTLTVRGEDARAAQVSAGLAAGRPVPDVLRAAGARYAVVHRTQPGAAAAERALAGLPVLFRSPELLLVELPGDTAPTPADRPWLAAVGLGAAAAGAGAVIVRGRRRLLRSRTSDE
jgi:hypothetical protein